MKTKKIIALILSIALIAAIAVAGSFSAMADATADPTGADSIISYEWHIWGTPSQITQETVAGETDTYRFTGPALGNYLANPDLTGDYSVYDYLVIEAKVNSTLLVTFKNTSDSEKEFVWLNWGYDDGNGNMSTLNQRYTYVYALDQFKTTNPGFLNNLGAVVFGTTNNVNYDCTFYKVYFTKNDPRQGSTGTTSAKPATTGKPATTNKATGTTAKVTGTVSNPTGTGTATKLPGDCTVDGNVNAADLLAMKKHILEISTLTGQGFINADMDGNNTINAADLLALKKFILTGVLPSTAATSAPATGAPTVPATAAPTVPATGAPTVPATAAPTVPATAAPTVPATAAPTVPATVAPTAPATTA